MKALTREPFHIPMSRWCEYANERIDELEWLISTVLLEDFDKGRDPKQPSRASFDEYKAARIARLSEQYARTQDA